MYENGVYYNDIIVKVISKKPKQVDVVDYGDSFIKVIHVPSGIAVTKHGSGNEIKTRDEALKELIILIRLWEN